MPTSNPGGGQRKGESGGIRTTKPIPEEKRIGATEIWNEISRQFREAQATALKKRAYIFEYTQPDGVTVTYYNVGGSRFERRRAPMYEKMFPDAAKRKYTAGFKRPSTWGREWTDKSTGRTYVERIG